MEEPQQDINYDKILETLVNTFGNVLSEDVYLTIIESCEGDLQESANAVVSIIMDGNSASKNEETEGNNSSLTNNVDVIPTQSNVQAVPDLSRAAQVPVPNKTKNISSYAKVSQTSRPQQQLKPKATTSTTNMTSNFWTNQIRQIMSQNESGARILIIMRGVPGSGKSFIAKQIMNAMYGAQLQQHYYAHVLSTDDFFINRGVYCYNKYRLQEAHAWNQSRAQQAMREGVSPVIIDNTNIEIWEMEPYVKEGVRNGYIVEVVEPNTPWAKKANELVKRNSHNVPAQTIKRMLDNYENGITGAVLMRKLNCYYDHRMQPPVLRLVPRVSRISQSISNMVKKIKVSEDRNEKAQQETQKVNPSQVMLQALTLKADVNGEVPSDDSKSESSNSIKHKEDKISTHQDEDELKNDNVEENDKFIEIKKTLEEIEKVEVEWETGESWDESSKKTNTKNDEQIQEVQGSKPQRKNRGPRTNSGEILFPNVEDCQDWSKISMFLPSWNEGSTSSVTKQVSPVVEKVSRCTCVEVGDTDIPNSNNDFKIITAVTRDINEFYVVSKNNKIPEKWMLDKSTSTDNNELSTNSYRCHNEEKHFSAFRKMFRHVARSDLRDIFDHCCGDVNWAVEIVLDGVENNQFCKVDEGEESSNEEEDSKVTTLCKCLSTYGVLPGEQQSSTSEQIIDSKRLAKTSSPSLQIKKTKKETVVSEASLELKRRMEQNIVIPDSMYSAHHLKIRNIRRGDYGNGENNNVDNSNPQISEQSEQESDQNNQESKHNEQESEQMDQESQQNEQVSGQNEQNAEQNMADNDQQTPSTSESIASDNSKPSTSKEDEAESSDDEYVAFEDQENTVNVNLGKEFVRHLDVLFGRDIDYPANVKPMIRIPVSLLNEINALWIESIMHQLAENAKQTELMIRQDEEFARELANKERELHKAGKEPAVPDFREIMDMEFALSLYRKDVAELCNNSKPQDLAAMLSRQKLKNLFPEIPADTLSEMLQAHDENFKATIEVLLISTNQEEILDEKDGINRFIAKRELERQRERLAREQKRILSEVEWPLLPKTDNVDMSVVQHYREQADQHLQYRNEYYKKAQEYVRRGMTDVATYCSGVAAFHKHNYEYSNSLAAAALIQFHGQNNPDTATIDLHFLRVSEAKESMDLFLDLHIKKLREIQEKGPVKPYTVYFITGRGLHSNGKPKIKPAVKKRLRERGLIYGERNPGLIQAKVSANDKLSHQVA